MSSRARRVSQHANVIAFPWLHTVEEQQAHVPLNAPVEPELPLPVFDRDEHLAALEREAFVKGYEQGERAGDAVAGQRGEAMLQRLTQTIEELTTLRAEMIRATERQMVELALAVARRIVHREVSIDADLLIAMARVALDRLGDSANVTVRLHPEEYEATGAGRTDALGNNVRVVADASVGRGGCRVDSDFGTLDAGIDAQMQELARALLGEADLAGGRG
jgi:flagellar assembly protein FliH